MEEKWFEQFKRKASKEQLYQFLYQMPKGGDLHNHLTGSGYSHWWYELATDVTQNGGYQYYTKTSERNCSNANSSALLFRNIQMTTYQKLTACEKSEYTLLSDLSEVDKKSWMNAIRLDKETEGRDEFFGFHWQRLNELTANPYLIAKMLIKNMQAFANEGVLYLETMLNSRSYTSPTGKYYSQQDVADIYRKALNSEEAKKTGVTVRLQAYILRFLPHAEGQLEKQYRFVEQNRDLYVGINMVGREDIKNGHPLRFLPTLRELRKTSQPIPLSIHAGEMDEPDSHVRDTLLLGATRIGHGVNLIDDPGTMLLMRNQRNLVEINLISNLLLEYVDDYSEHPFPEYLRTGIPVALSTDDRGMWDSNLTDEYYVAVTEFNLSWDELIQLGENSIQYGFMQEDVKQGLLKEYRKRMSKFSKQFDNPSFLQNLPGQINTGQFICGRYQVCLKKHSPHQNLIFDF